jgi:nucleoside-diphosphate-sugar epimerase
MRILVFGGTGFVGLNTASALLARGHKVTLFDRIPDEPLVEETACDPVSLYAITKFASEKVAARLASLWQCEVVSVRLSAMFGPWERATAARDTLSPQAQILAALQEGREAVLERPGVRDWIYAFDVADAVVLKSRKADV